MINETTVLAVNAAVQVLSLMGRLNTDRDDHEQIVRVANSFLESHLDSVTKDEIGDVIDILNAGRYVATQGGALTPLVNARRQAPSFKGKKGQQRMIDMLAGDSLYLYFYPLKDQADEEYIIEFNYDGVGGIRLPNGETLTRDQGTLGTLAKQLLTERKLTYQIVTQNHWIVSRNHHPDASDRSSKASFKTYMNERYRQNLLTS